MTGHRVLDQIDGWDASRVAVEVTGPDGTVATSGDPDRPFRLASVSKVLFAVAAMVAVEEGSISLDDHPVDAPEGATVRHLLAHAAGLPPDGDGPPLGPPAHRRIYSNVGFELLGAHLASCTRMSAADYVRAAVVEPLELRSTTVDGSPAHGYSSTASDLATLLRAVVGGLLLAPETAERMTSPAWPELAGVLPGFGAQDPNPWGLGVEVRGRKHPHWSGAANSPSTWGHFGRSGTMLWWDPQVDLGLVVLTDREFGPWAADAWPALSDDVRTAFRPVP